MSGSSLFPVVAAKAVYVASTGVAATDTAAIMAAHDSFNATNGGMIALDQGPYAITPGVINFTKPIYLQGTGPNVANGHYSTSGTLLTFSSQAGKMITVNSDYCAFEKIQLYNSHGAPTAGNVGIYCPTGGYYMRLRDVIVSKFYDCFTVLDHAVAMKLESSKFLAFHTGATLQDASFPDEGDHSISNCDFVALGAPSNRGIYWGSGGGPKITNCKFINGGSGTGWNSGIMVQLNLSATTATWLIANNSIEACTTGVEVTTAAGSMYMVSVIGNEFLVTGNPIRFQSDAGHTTGILTAIGNVNNPSSSGTAIIVENVDSVTLDSNVNCTLSINPGGAGAPTNLRISHKDFSFSTAGRPAASIMAAGSSYYDTTLHLVGTADGAGNWRKPDATIF